MNKTFYINEVEKIDFCGQTMLMFRGSNFALPYNIIASDGNHSYKTCSGCLGTKKSVMVDLGKMRTKFPNCCEGHARLVSFGKYKELDFDNLEEPTADKVMFTYHHVVNNIENDNWFTDITDYISYAIDSFGSFPTGYGSPFLLSSYYAIVKNLVDGIPPIFECETITKKELCRRITELLKYLTGVFEATEKNDSDLNILLSNYDKWYSTFPFQLDFFSHLREKYQAKIPILKNGRLNKYSGNTVLTLHTKQSLTEYLIETTVSILAELNSLKLYEEGTITNIEKLKLDILLAERKVQLADLGSINNKSRTGYIRVLKKWFKDEAVFLSKIEPYLQKQPADNNARPNSTDIAIFFYYVFQTREYKTLKNKFPSDAAWVEIKSIYNKDAKNTQLAYNKIVRDEAIRLTKKRNIEYVVDNMLKPYPMAKKLAEKELNMAN